MSQYEYKVVAAPERGKKAKGVRSPEARFSLALEEAMNALASDGWEYQRAEALPSLERSGFTSSKTVMRHVLVFRRAKPTTMEQGTRMSDRHPPLVAQKTTHLPPIVTPANAEDDASKSQGASRMLRDNGVEDLSDVSGVTKSLTQLSASRNISKPTD